MSQVAIYVYGIDPVHFGLIMVFNLVLALIHPPIGLVIFLVSSLAKVSVERLSIMILPWLAVSLVVLFLVTYLPSEAVLALSNLIRETEAGRPTPSASPRCSPGGRPMCPRPGWSRPGPRSCAAGARLTARRRAAAGAARRCWAARCARVGPSMVGVAGPHPDDPVLRGGVLGDRSRPGRGCRRCSPTPTPCSWRCWRRCSSASAVGPPVVGPADRAGGGDGGGLGGPALAAGAVARRPRGGGRGARVEHRHRRRRPRDARAGRSRWPWPAGR